MKKLFLSVAILLLVIAAGFIALNTYIYNEKQASDNDIPDDNTEREISGVVTNLDFINVAADGPVLIELKTEMDETFTVAVPSMGFRLCAASVRMADVYDIEVEDQVSVRGTMDEEGRIVPCSDPDHFLSVAGTYIDEEAQFSFDYPKGPNGYQLESETSQSDDVDYINGVSLVETENNSAAPESTEPTEALPTIQVSVYLNPENQSPAAWAESHADDTNIERALSEVEETTVGQAEAVRFMADGLYASDMYVISRGEHIVLLQGEYLDRDSNIYRTFTNIVEEFEFIQPLN